LLNNEFARAYMEGQLLRRRMEGVIDRAHWEMVLLFVFRVGALSIVIASQKS
jgi:hypothetical protein